MSFRSRRWTLGLAIILTAMALAVVVVRERPFVGPALAQEAASASGDYVGASLCRSCHRELYAAWEKTPHGKTLLDASLPPAMRACEACHGPGSKHVGSTGKEPVPHPLEGQPVKEAEAVCAGCHMSDAASDAPADWPRIERKYWRDSLHSTKGTGCLQCHRLHGGAARALQEPPDALCLRCHKKLVNSAEGGYTHSPVAKGQCVSCHVPHGGPDEHDTLSGLSDLCLSCHDATTDAWSKAHHGVPTAKSDCVGCHNPHSFNRDAALLRKFRHQPFDKGQCAACHEGGGDTAQLSRPLERLCISCHPESEILHTANREENTMVQHSPAKRRMCTICHASHVSDQGEQLLRGSVQDVCLQCHRAIEKEISAEVTHQPVAVGNCLLCHNGHAAEHDGLLKRDSLGLCTMCHAAQGRFTHPVGMRDDKPVLDPNTGRMLVCVSCHSVHGSQFPGLLSAEQDALCRQCHAK